MHLCTVLTCCKRNGSYEAKQCKTEPCRISSCLSTVYTNSRLYLEYSEWLFVMESAGPLYRGFYNISMYTVNHIWKYCKDRQDIEDVWFGQALGM